MERQFHSSENEKIFIMTKTAFNWIFKNLRLSQQAWPHETLASIDHQIFPGMPVFLFHPLDSQGRPTFSK